MKQLDARSKEEEKLDIDGSSFSENANREFFEFVF